MNRILKSITIIIVLLATAGISYYLGRKTEHADGMNQAAGTADTSGREIAYWRAPMDPTEIYDKPGKSRMGMDLVPVYTDEEAKPDKQERKILYWQAPMNPSEIYDKPGKSAMGMDLVPVYEDEAGAKSGGLVRIDPATVQNMGVRTTQVVRSDFSRTIRTVGKVEYDEETLYEVNSRISGWIEKLYAEFQGAEVKKGAPLIEIYSPELVSTQEEYLLAIKNYRKAEASGVESEVKDAQSLVESARKRLAYWNVPDPEIRRLEETGEVKRTLVLNSPATGVVVTKQVVEGEFVKAGMNLFEVADLSTVWVHASLYDYEVPWVKVGQSAVMELSYLPGKSYKGTVSYIYPYLRDKARDVHVRLVFQNKKMDFKPGMYVNVDLESSVIPNALLIPSEAVLRSGARSIVFVDRGSGTFEPRSVVIGEEGGPGNRYVRVLSGLLESDRVVISAQFMLDSESRLQEAIQKMLHDRSDGEADPDREAPDSAGVKAGMEESTGMNGMTKDAARMDSTGQHANMPMP